MTHLPLTPIKSPQNTPRTPKVPPPPPLNTLEHPIHQKLLTPGVLGEDDLGMDVGVGGSQLVAHRHLELVLLLVLQVLTLEAEGLICGNLNDLRPPAW